MALPKRTIRAPKAPRAPEKIPTFAEFYAEWCVIHDLKVSKTHWEVVKFLENHETWHNKTAVLQIWRGIGKSTITQLYAVWRLVKDPTTRIMIFSGVNARANRMAQAICEPSGGIIVKHPMSKHLFDKTQVWRSEEVWVVGNVDLGNPSIGSKGLESSFTGFRCDLAIIDDGEVPENSGTPGEREKLRANIAETGNILDTKKYGERLFIGTPQHYESIYPELVDKLGATELCIPVMSDIVGEFPYMTGKYRDPEFYGEAYVLKKQKEQPTKGAFFNQYLMERVTTDDARLNPAYIITYDTDIDWREANDQLFARIGARDVKSFSCFWDPSMAADGGDKSIISVVYSTDDGHYFIHEIESLKGDADEQCSQAVQFCLRNKISRVTIETNGIGNFLPHLFRKYGGPFGVVAIGKHTSINKAEKIVVAYETRLSAKLLHAHHKVINSPFYTQMRDFNAKRIKGAKNDYIDSVAMAIINEPIRIGRGVTVAGQGARFNGGSGSSVIEVEWSG